MLLCKQCVRKLLDPYTSWYNQRKFFESSQRGCAGCGKQYEKTSTVFTHNWWVLSGVTEARTLGIVVATDERACKTLCYNCLVRSYALEQPFHNETISGSADCWRCGHPVEFLVIPEYLFAFFEEPWPPSA